jgi:hypothetical protein
MIHFLGLVSHYGDIQRQLQDELDAAFPGDIADDWVAPDFVVNSLPVLDAALKESIRINSETDSTAI